MSASAHDIEHVYRVLNYAFEIARHENGAVDHDILTISCLLHDIGRVSQYENPKIDHAIDGAEKAYEWLINNGYTHDFALDVKRCIESHRFRSSNPPQSIEAKILFDADKLDVCGAVGIARALLSIGQCLEPLYSLSNDGEVLDGENDSQPSFFHEYKYKLEKLHSKFFTVRGIEIAEKRRFAAETFYNALLMEVKECYSYSSER
jgi:uncharacterized protein